MTEAKNIPLYESKLKRLKREESILVEILLDVRKQINRYKVEELHISSVPKKEPANPVSNDNESESDLSDDEKLTAIAKELDCVDEINKKPLNLDIDKKFDEDFMEEEEEEEEDDIEEREKDLD